MRELKFRIYSKHDNKIIFPEELNFRNAFKEWNEVQRTEGLGVSTYDSLNDTLMQFTGLLDKNGKEIYEGDIIKHNDNKYIAWYTDNFGLMFIKVETFSNDRVLRMSHRYRDYNWAYNVKKYIEVIGNIHED